MSFKDELKQIKNRAGVVEAEVADLGAKRREKETGLRADMRKEMIQNIKQREALMSQLAENVVESIRMSAILIVKHDPEIIKEMGARSESEAVERVLQDQQFIEGQIEPVVTNLEEQLRSSFGGS